MEKVNISPPTNYIQENKSPNKLREEWDDYLKLIREIDNIASRGDDVFFEVMKGKYKGSIFYADELVLGRKNYYGDKYYHLSTEKVFDRYPNNPYITMDCRMRFKGRSNKPKCERLSDCLYLRGYSGDTKYQLFNREAAKEKFLLNNNCLDKRGDLISVGDEVYYINLRYGSGARLSLGVVDEISATCSVHHSEWKIVVKENETGEISNISQPSNFILKTE